MKKHIYTKLENGGVGHLDCWCNETMMWTEERLRKLSEINQQNRILRYFNIKNFVEKIVEEEMTQ